EVRISTRHAGNWPISTDQLNQHASTGQIHFFNSHFHLHICIKNHSIPTGPIKKCRGIKTEDFPENLPMPALIRKIIKEQNLSENREQRMMTNLRSANPWINQTNRNLTGTENNLAR